MKTYYIGRIKLSKEDSKGWYKTPPYMYVTENKNEAFRDNVKNAKMFESKRSCINALKKNFAKFGHLPSSKMEVVTLILDIGKIEELKNGDNKISRSN